MRVRIPSTTIACATLLAGVASGQGTGRLSPVRGVVFDSVSGKPLRDAFVTIRGVSQSTTTDSRGRFHFDSVPAGTQTFAVQHSVLDSLGLYSLSREATVGGDDGEVHVAVPSFATLWRRLCPTTRAPDDSAIVFGTVRNARGKAAQGNTRVEISWTELTTRTVVSPQGLTGFRRIPVERIWHADTRTTAGGSYVVCGVPVDEPFRVSALSDSGATSGTIELPLSKLRVRRRDLYVVGMVNGHVETGMVVGLLTDPSGGPFIDARVTIGDSLEVRSDFDGRVIFPSVPAGTRQVVVRYVGTNPIVSAVDVMAGDTAHFAIEIPRVARLATTYVTSPERARMLHEELAERRVVYHRYMIDSSEIGKEETLADLLYRRPGIMLKRRGPDMTIQFPDTHGRACTPDIRIDGVLANDVQQLLNIPPNRVVSLEIYPRAHDMPAEYERGGVRYPCGLVAVWTKWAFRIP